MLWSCKSCRDSSYFATKMTGSLSLDPLCRLNVSSPCVSPKPWLLLCRWRSCSSRRCWECVGRLLDVCQAVLQEESISVLIYIRSIAQIYFLCPVYKGPREKCVAPAWLACRVACQTAKASTPAKICLHRFCRQTCRQLWTVVMQSCRHRCWKYRHLLHRQVVYITWMLVDNCGHTSLGLWLRRHVYELMCPHLPQLLASLWPTHHALSCFDRFLYI